MEDSPELTSVVRRYSELHTQRDRLQQRLDGVQNVSPRESSRLSTRRPQEESIAKAAPSTASSIRRSVSIANECLEVYREDSMNLQTWDIVRQQLKDAVTNFGDWNTHRAMKQISATSHVLRTYHDSFLLGVVPPSLQVRSRLRAGLLGIGWHMLESALALLSGVLYVYSTYRRAAQNNWVSEIQNAISVAFLADYMLRVYCEPVRLYYVISFWGLVDFLSAVPVILIFRIVSNGDSIFRLLQFVRILRIFAFAYRAGAVGSSVVQQILLLTVATFGIILLDAGIIHWVEYNTAPRVRKDKCSEEGCITFWQAFYFLIATVSTVGFGDVTPKTILGQFVTIVTIVAALSLLPIQIGRVTSLADRRPYGGSYSSQKIVGSRFLIISGSISIQYVQNFLAEFYNPTRSEDLDAYPLRVVILAPFSPSFELKQLLAFYDDLVEFIEGSPVRQSDLERVNADKAMAFFLLADRDAPNPEVEDSAQIVRALAVHRFCRGQKHRYDMRILLEVLDPESQTSAVWDESHTGGIEVICPVKVHYMMMARSCKVRGLYTLMTNLFTSEIQLKHVNKRHFLTEYFHSFDNEVFPVILSSDFYGTLFEDAVRVIHSRYNSTLFAVDTLIAYKGTAVRKVLLNPTGYRIKADDVGIVISGDLHTAYAISLFDKDGSNVNSKLLKSLCDCAETDLDIMRSTEGIELRTRSGRWTMYRDNSSRTTESSSLGASSTKSGRDFKSIIRKAFTVSKDLRAPGVDRAAGPDELGTFQDHRLEIPEVESAVEYIAHREKERFDVRTSTQLSYKVKRTNLENAAENLLAWPPQEMNHRPQATVLDQMAHLILKNLEERMLNVVAFNTPHILVCCQAGWPAHLFYFLLELRKPGVPHIPVVILYPRVPTAKQWGTVGVFKGVFFLKGSPVYELDLMRGGVLQAENVVILADQGVPLDFGTSDFQDMKFVKRAPSAYTSDVENIVVAANVQRLYGRKSVDLMIVEMQDAKTFYYLEPQYEVSHGHFAERDLKRNRDALNHFVLPFMEGKAVSSTMLGFLLRSSFYNRNTVSIVEQLVRGGGTYVVKTEPHTGDGVHEQDEINDVDDGQLKLLAQIPVPTKYAHGLYSALFLGLLQEQGVVALGLFRARGTLGAPSPYVLTNPKSDCTVNPDDLVYIVT
ncbi:hypothetical protein R1sor_023135 [Riccia sorocarpa]|uniref:Uncharacterized protein n=1 Tax=Riccia sorocarpa TaxID=122646 RepID=A0ABD3GST5_9MARC